MTILYQMDKQEHPAFYESYYFISPQCNDLPIVLILVVYLVSKLILGSLKKLKIKPSMVKEQSIL